MNPSDTASSGIPLYEPPLYETALPIREDLMAAHREVVSRWSRPGTWWTASERLAMVGEVRRARDAETVPPPWVPASSVDGLVAEDHVLPAVAVDAIWRLTNHPGTLTEAWYQGIVTGTDNETETDTNTVGSGISASRYTELVGVVAQANAIDRFADGLSLARVELPEPVEGEPTRLLPDGAAQRDHWVPTVALDAAQVLRALSGVPEENVTMFILSDAQYLPIAAMADVTADRNALTRMQVELVAARTSKLNECFY